MRLSNYLSLAGLEAHVKLVSRIAIVLSFFSSGEARAQAPFDSTVQAVLTPMMSSVRRVIDSRTVPGIRWSRISDVGSDLTRTYENIGWNSIWVSRGRPTQAALGTIRYLRSLDRVGLSPTDFDIAVLDSIAQHASSDTLDESRQARFEVTLSVATARALSSLRWGRVHQSEAYPTLRRSRAEFDVALGVYATARTPEPSPVFETAEPPYGGYRELVAALQATRRMARDSVLVAGEDAALSPGMAYADAAALRRVVRALGVLSDSAPPVVAVDTIYDEGLAAAVSRFQRENRRKANGVLDAGTRTAMRRLFERRARDAELALERWRWLPRKADGRAIIVNVPEYKLLAYEHVRSDARPSFTMKVVVGKGEEKRYTPMFVDAMEHIIFSPYWEVPQTIAVDEIVPKATEDPKYMARNRYVLVKGYSDSAPRVPVDSSTLAGVGRSIRVRQLPGDYNSLGRIKFMLPNHLNIYLHDTNEKHLFQSSQRAFSHGCVRVSEPNRLAEWALRSDTSWTIDRMKSAMKAKEPEKVELAEHIPVMIVYHTAAVDDNGVLRAYRDVYELNDDLSERLGKGYPYAR